MRSRLHVTSHAQQRMEDTIELAEKNLSELYRFAYFCLGKSAEAGEAVQEAFVRMFRDKGLRQGGFEPVIMLYRAEVSICSDRSRGWRGRRHAMRSALQDIQKADLAEETQSSILLLPIQLRVILILSDVCGLGREQIGQILGIDERETAARLSRARRKLRDLLIRHMPSESGTIGGTCERMHELCSAYVDGTISEREKSMLLDHIERCTHCATYLQALTAVGRQMAKLEKAPPPELLSSVRSAVQREMENLPLAEKRRNNLQIAIFMVAVSAAIIVLLCSGVFSGVFLNGTRGGYPVAGSGTQNKEQTEVQSDLPKSVSIPAAVAANSYNFAIVLSGSEKSDPTIGLEDLGALLTRDEDAGVEYYSIKADMGLLQKMNERARAAGYQESTSTDSRITISKDAREGLIILIR